MKINKVCFFALVFMAFGFSAYAQVYISGSYSDGVTTKACYWVDGKRVDLPEGIITVGIAVENGIVYAAGYYRDGGRTKACYWENGVKRNLYIGNRGDDFSDSYGYITGIAVSDSKVYVTGYGNFLGPWKACWIDGTYTEIGSIPTGVTVSDGIAYFLHSDGYTAYGQKQSLSGPSLTSSGTSGITVADGRVYVSGIYRYGRDGEVHVPCYWVDGARIDLATASQTQLRTSGIAVGNGAVYVSGSSYQNNDPIGACYWVNGSKVDIPDGVRTSGIAVANRNVYVIGYYKQGSIEIPCYWENGVRKALPGGRTVMGIVAIHSTSTTSGTETPSTSGTYSIGGKGPGGGTIFYASSGKYMECSGELGSYVWETAVTTARNYKGGDFSDWRLPTKDELNFMYVNLKARNLGGFSNNGYWSQSDSRGVTLKWYQNFSDGSQDDDYTRNQNSVRAVRSF